MRGERRCWASAVYRCSSLWDHRAEQSPVPRVPMGRCGVKSVFLGWALSEGRDHVLLTLLLG